MIAAAKIVPKRRSQRPTFTLRLRAEPGVDAIRALRAALKVLLRRYRLRAISISEDGR
jgi:hypothetical protein